MTKLHQWVSAHGKSAAALAEAVGVHRVTAHKYLNGTMMPRPRVAAAIRDFTGGAVTPADLAADYVAAKAEAK